MRAFIIIDEGNFLCGIDSALCVIQNTVKKPALELWVFLMFSGNDFLLPRDDILQIGIPLIHFGYQIQEFLAHLLFEMISIIVIRLNKSIRSQIGGNNCGLGYIHIPVWQPVCLAFHRFKKLLRAFLINLCTLY